MPELITVKEQNKTAPLSSTLTLPINGGSPANTTQLYVGTLFSSRVVLTIHPLRDFHHCGFCCWAFHSVSNLQIEARGSNIQKNIAT